MDEYKKDKCIEIIAPALLFIGYTFEIIRSVIKKDTGSLSWMFMICLCIIGILLIIYGHNHKNNLAKAEGIVIVLANIILLSLKTQYHENNRSADDTLIDML